MPTSVMDLPGFPTLVDARYRVVVEEEAADITDVREDLFTLMDSDRLDEYATEIGELGSWAEFSGQVTYDQLYEQFATQARAREYATGTIVTRRMVDYDLSGVLNGARFRPMVRAGLVTRQEHATRLYENMGNIDNYYYTYSEGVALVSSSHTTRTPSVSTSAGFSNLTTAALSPVAVRAIQIAGRKIKNDRGKRSNLNYDTVICPVDLVPRMMEILKTPWGLDSPYRNVNPESAQAMGIKKVIALPYWTSTTNYAFVNERNMKMACRWLRQVEPEFGRITEFDTLQIKSRGYMRHGYMVIMNGRFWIYGAIVT